jgi:pSer/pThr/pTyr-binding forkhead associated (FHA) protein
MPVNDTPCATLVVTAAEFSTATEPRHYNIGSQPFSIGRRDSASLRLSSGSASFSHAKIQDDSFVRLHALTDERSSNGTAVNGLYVHRTLLHDGDLIEFPDTRAYYFREGSKAASLDRERLAVVDDELRRELVGADPMFIVFWIRNYPNLADAFGHHVLRAISEHIVTTLNALIPFGRIESLKGGFEYVLVTNSASHAVTAETIGNATRRLAVANVDNERSIALAVENATSFVSSAEALAKLTAPEGRSSARTVEQRQSFNWVHLSDLHAGAGNTGWRADHEQVVAAMIRDLAERSPRLRIDRVIVTGDVSFSGGSAQFAEATNMLRLLSTACDVGLEQVRLVPGNHDVQRELAAMPVTRALHAQVRQSETLLDTYLADQRGRAILVEKLSGFSQFIDSFPGHPRAVDALDWVEECAVGERLLRIYGLCSVWVSDSQDGHSREGTFLANLALSQRAVLELARSVTASDATLVLTHHPLQWLMPQARRWLQDALSANAGLHLCGHIHSLDATQTSRGGSLPSAVMTAGAAHAGVDESPVHSYSWGSLLWNPKKQEWELGWSPRVFVPERGEMRPDRMRHDLDQQGFCWMRLPARSRVRVPSSSVDAVDQGPHMTSGDLPVFRFSSKD